MKSSNIKIFLTFCLLLLTLLSSSVKGQESNLQTYIQLGLTQNPNLRAQELTFLAIEKDIDQAGEFSDPELSMSFYTKPMDIVGGRSIGDLTLMQSIPWFGTKKSAKSQAKYTSLAAYQDYLQAKQQLILSIKTQWYTLQDYQQQLINLQKSQELLDQLESLAIQKYSSPQSNSTTSSNSMTDVLRIGLERLEIENNIANIQNIIKSEKGKFNILLNQDVDQEIVVDSTLEPVEFLIDQVSALQQITQTNPVLEKIDQQALAYKAKAEMDKKLSYPNIGIGLQYMIIAKTSDPMLAMGSMNGKDMLMPMLSVSLPVFRKKYKAQQNQSKLWWESSNASKQEVINQLTSEFQSYLFEFENAKRTIELYQKQSELAQRTYNLIVVEFSGGKNDLTNVFQVQKQLIDYQLKLAQATVQYNKAVASIQSLMITNYTNTLSHE